MEKGKLPAQPIQNPKGQLQIGASSSEDQHIRDSKAITALRSGKIVDNKVQMPPVEPNPMDIPKIVDTELDAGDLSSPNGIGLGEDLPQVPAPIVPPFPQRLKNKQDRKSVVRERVFRAV